MTTVNEQNCRAALRSNLAAGSDLAHEIHLALRKRYDAADDMDVDWGHVGSAGRVAEELREIAEMLGIEVDR